MIISKKKLALIGATALTLVALACQGTVAQDAAPAGSGSQTRAAAAAPTPVPPTAAPVPPASTAVPPASATVPPTAATAPKAATAVPPAPTAAPAQAPQAAPTPKPKAKETPKIQDTPKPAATPAAAPANLTFGWDNTDFSKHSVPFREIFSGGPPRDGIPPIDSPKFIPVSDSPDYMNDNEPVIALEINGESKAYPIAILMWHEIVNDELGGIPVSVTYCPLCNTAIVFDRRIGDKVYDFGTSGKLRKSDLVMWDRQTESWWQQILGEAIVGELTGTKLTFIPAPMVSWAEFREGAPDGLLLSRETGFRRTYGRAPYGGYDALGNTPFLFSGEINTTLDAMERVVGFDDGANGVAYPFAVFGSVPIINDTVGERDIVIFFAPDTNSGFAGLSGPRVVGSTAVYDPNLDGQKLTFNVVDAKIVDEQTGSVWNMLGEATEGNLAGKQLQPVVHANHFWFAWSAFFPQTEIRGAEYFGS